MENSASNFIQNKTKGEIVEAKEEKNNSSEEKLLGELLRSLRVSQEMKTLVVCREIKRLNLQDSTAVIEADNEILEELELPKPKELLTEFFKTRGLSYTLKKGDNKDESIEKLQKLLGGKLKIK